MTATSDRATKNAYNQKKYLVVQVQTLLLHKYLHYYNNITIMTTRIIISSEMKHSVALFVLLYCFSSTK